jgi:hypothetical protein
VSIEIENDGVFIPFQDVAFLVFSEISRVKREFFVTNTSMVDSSPNSPPLAKYRLLGVNICSVPFHQLSSSRTRVFGYLLYVSELCLSEVLGAVGWV